MKNTKLVFAAMLVSLSVLSLVMTACPDSSRTGGGGDDNFDGTVWEATNPYASMPFYIILKFNKPNWELRSYLFNVPVEEDTVIGTYIANGNFANLSDTDNSQGTATISGNELTMVLPPGVLPMSTITFTLRE
jgi:hypothetical protein